MKNNVFKQFIMVIMIFALISGLTVMAEEGQTNTSTGTTLKMSFPDVPKDNWANKHVSKLVLLGITEGNTDGEYKPNNFIKQQDAIKMAVSLMGYTLEDLDHNIAASHSTHEAVFLNENVDTYAIPYVSFALMNDLIIFDEEKGNTGKWGSNSATREWIAKVVIRAIGKEDRAAELENQTALFSDQFQISTWALGYVNAAVEANIVSGFSDGSFKPQEFVTRAQIAAFLGRAEPHLNERSDRIKVGTLIAMNKNSLTLADEEGITSTYNINPNIQFYSSKKDKAILSVNVNLLYKVYLIQDQNIAYYLEITDEELQLDRVEGKLISKDTTNIENQTIKLTVDGVIKEYSLNKNVIVMNKDGSGSSVGSLKDHSTLILGINRYLSEPKVTRITIEQTPVNKVASGVVNTIDAATNLITLSDNALGTSALYSTSNELSVIYGDRVLKGLVDLEVGDKVNYEIKNDVVVSIELIESITPFVEYQGVVYDFNIDRQDLYIKNPEGNIIHYKMAAVVKVILEGINAATLENLEFNDEVTFKINKNNEIEEIQILNRKIEQLTQVVIFDFDPVTMSLIVRLNNDIEDFKIDEATTVDGNLNWTTSVLDAIFLKDKKVDMTFSNSKLIDVKLSSDYIGNVTKIDSAAKKITISTANDEIEFTLISSSFVELYNQTSSSLSDIKVGDTVNLTLNASQSSVDKVQVKKSPLFRIVSTNPSTKEVTVTDLEGMTKIFYVNTNIPIKHYAKTNAIFSDMIANEPIIVNYYGHTVVSVELPNASLGKVTAIDLTNNKITVDSYTDQINVFTWQNSPQVYINGALAANGMNALTVNDRINVVQDTTGKLTITILEKKERNFKRYVEVDKSVQFIANNWSEDVDFTYNENIHIHQNGTPLAITDLVFLNKTTFYTLNGVLVEIEKH